MHHFDRSMMYFGDDYGGHNIPYPHPRPPQPHKFYQQDAFVDLLAYYHEDDYSSKNSGYSHDTNHGNKNNYGY